MSSLRVLLLSSSTTMGQSASDIEFEAMLSEAGADVVRAIPRFPKLPGFLLHPQILDLVEAFRLRQELRSRWARGTYDCVVFATTTATFLQPRSVLQKGALRFDALAAENRRGPLKVLSRLLERRSVSSIPILMPMSSSRDVHLGRTHYLQAAATVITMPPSMRQETAGGTAEPGLVLGYVSNPYKKGLDVILQAWAIAAPQDAVLKLAGITAEQADRFAADRSLTIPPGVEFLGRLPQQDFLAVQRRAQLFLAATRYEDYGMVQLEALNCGTLVVTAPSAGPFEVRTILEAVDPQLIATEFTPQSLADSVRYALRLTADERRDRVTTARTLLDPYLWPQLLDRVRTELIPALERVSRGR